MSTINKKPFLKYVLESMSPSEISTLSELMDGNGVQTPIFRTMNLPSGNRTNITVSDKGVRLCDLEIGFTLFKGYLIYTDDYCALFHFTDSTVMGMFDIDTVSLKKYATVSESLTVVEFRSEVNDFGGGGGGSSTFKPFSEDWPTSNASTTAQFCAAVDADDTATVGMAYLGGASWSDLPFEGNGDVVVEIMQGPGDTKSIHLILTSGNVAPYHWEYTYWNHGSTSGWITLGGGVPSADAPNKVIVSNEQNEAEWQNAAPMADNLTPRPINNDALYTSGPTGGLADISTGQEAYLNEIKGYTIIWNQLVDANNSYSGQQGRYYIRISNGKPSFFGPSYTNTVSGSDRLIDLTLMFGGNDKIPFSLTEYEIYPANGTLPAQKNTPAFAFSRLFANVDFLNLTRDLGTPKNVSVTKLTESGQNLWNENDADMVANGLMLLAGYIYEIYLDGYSKSINTFTSTGWLMANLTRYQRADGKYIWAYQPNRNTLIKTYNSSYPIKYVGFVHSGNYCLTTGTLNYSNYAITDATIPAFVKYEFPISGISGLNGVTLDDGTIIADTKDYQRVGHIADFSTLTWTGDSDTWTATIPGIKPFTTGILASKYINNVMSVHGDGTITITSSSSPTGELFYELDEPVATGQDAFEPIPLKSGDKWIVNDMGSEFFTQPANTNCPVNQLSIYYENLRDKLINLTVPEIEQADYKYGSDALSGLKINGTTYKILPIVNDKTYTDAIAIGASAGVYGQGVCIGQNSGAYGDGVSIGRYATSGGSGVAIGTSTTNSNGKSVSIGKGVICDSQYSVALGNYARNPITQSVTFDGTSTTFNDSAASARTSHFKEPVNIFFRGENVSTSKTTFASYTAGHYLSEYIQNNDLILGYTEGSVTNWYVQYTDGSNYKTFTEDVSNGTATAIDKKITGVHITVKLYDASTWESVAGLDLLPYDSVNNKPIWSCGRILFGTFSDGTVVDIYACIMGDGTVEIHCPQLDFESAFISVKYFIR